MILNDKVVVITGASYGLGESLARILTAKGAKLVISSRSKDKLEKLATEIGADFVVADVSKEEDINKLTNEALTRFGRIDLWINNAGVWLSKSLIEHIDMNKAKAMFETNVFGTVYGTRSALVEMKKQNAGTIVNIISTSGLNGRPNTVMYCASKYAVRGFTESLQEELKDSPIKLIAVYPGGIKTFLFNEDTPADFETFMSPESVAEKIITNLEKENPDKELIIKRPALAAK